MTVSGFLQKVYNSRARAEQGACPGSEPPQHSHTRTHRGFSQKGAELWKRPSCFPRDRTVADVLSSALPEGDGRVWSDCSFPHVPFPGHHSRPLVEFGRIWGSQGQTPRRETWASLQSHREDDSFRPQETFYPSLICLTGNYPGNVLCQRLHRLLWVSPCVWMNFLTSWALYLTS